MDSANEGAGVMELPGNDVLTEGIEDPGARMRSRIDGFRVDAAYARKAFEDKVRKSAHDLIPEDDQDGLSGRSRAVLRRYAVLDTMAMRYRDRTYRIFLGLLACSLAAMVVLEVFAHVLPEHLPLGAVERRTIWLFPIFWILAYLLWLWAHLREYQKKFHDYRALAEALRVQVFWTLLGLQDPIERVYLYKQRGELEWIRRVLAWWRLEDETRFPRHGQSTVGQAKLKSLVLRRWIDGQREYFSRSAKRQRRRSQLCKRAGLAFLILSLVAAAGLGLYEGAALRQPGHGLLPQQSILILVLAMFLSLAALAVAYGEKMAFSEHARQYAATSQLFDGAKKEIQAGPLTEGDLTRFRHLGEEALRENGDWLLIHRDRPLEVIVP
jgi:hypothetical protein